MGISSVGGQKGQKNKGPEPCGVRAIVGGFLEGEKRRHGAPGGRETVCMAEFRKAKDSPAAAAMRAWQGVWFFKWLGFMENGGGLIGTVAPGCESLRYATNLLK